MSTTARSAIEIVRCRPDQVSALQQFLHDHWRARHILSRDRALLDWQYDGRRCLPPWDGPSVLLATHHGAIVGIQCVIGARFCAAATVVPGAWLSNLMVIPSARGHGAGLKLMAAVHAQQWAAVFDVGINPDVLPLFAASGYHVIERVPRWVGVFDPTAASAVWRAAGGGDAEPAWPTVRRSEARVQPSGVRHWTGPFGAAWSRAWTSRFAPRLIGTHRDAAYLNWRYVDHPRFTYRALVVRQRGIPMPAGVAIYRIESIAGRAQRVMRIVEFLAEPEVEDQLAGALMETAWGAGVDYADFYCTAESCTRALARCGFEEEAADGAPLPTRLQPVEGGPFRMTAAWRCSVAAPHAELYITKSDGDMDRPN